MLREEVTDAVKQGKFHVYAASSVDEGIEVLTDIEVGEEKEDGTYPEGSINYKVERYGGEAKAIRRSTSR
jgi:hypothetical protein